MSLSSHYLCICCIYKVTNQKLRSVPCDLQVLHSHMKKEIESSQSSFTAYDLLRTAGMRRISICLIVVWSEIILCLSFHLSSLSPVHLSSLSPVFFVTRPPVFFFGCPSAAVCLPLQVLHQFCILRFGHGFAEVWGESPDRQRS